MDRKRLYIQKERRKEKHMTREELKKKLLEMGNGYVTTWGTSAISKDLIGLLEEREDVVEICAARKSSLFKFFKGGKYVRCYLAITSKRFIYIERGRMIMTINPFCKKTIIANRNKMRANLLANNKIEKILYPYTLQIQTEAVNCELSVDKDISQFLRLENRGIVPETMISNKEGYCSNCGKKLEEGWNYCPFCSK